MRISSEARMITTNINQFLKKFKENQQLVIKASEKVVNETLLEMYKRVVDRTPVGNPALWKFQAPKDYTPGTLKKSWQLSFGGMRDQGTGRFVSTQSIVGKHGISFQVRGGNKTAFIYNKQPYAERVENGWSTQAPAGMMRITIAEYTMLIDKNAAKYRIR